MGLSTIRDKGYDKRMKKVITYGTFDLIHHGHINILRRAKAMGDYLIVALSTDEFNAGKGKQVYYAYEERKQILEAIKYVDEVIPETRWEQKIDDVVKHGVSVFVIGDDWTGKFDFLKPYCEVVYLPRTEGISTTQIKNELGASAGPTKSK
jgi:glycerol-3-phosphate cytidylyltransferase